MNRSISQFDKDVCVVTIPLVQQAFPTLLANNGSLISKLFNMKLAIGILLVSLLVVSCNDKEEPTTEFGCDCQGRPARVLKDALAIQNKSAISVLDPDHLQQGWVIHSAVYCNPEFVKGKTNDVDSVYVSGNLRAPCSYGDWNYLQRLEVTSIRRK